MEKRGQIIGISLVAGVSIGVLVGAVTDNVSFWVASEPQLGYWLEPYLLRVEKARKAEK